MISARAAASGSAYAYANVDSAIVQTVNGLSASAVFSNSGTIVGAGTAANAVISIGNSTGSVTITNQNNGTAYVSRQAQVGFKLLF